MLEIKTVGNASKLDPLPLPYSEMPELEKYILHKLSIIDAKVKDDYRKYDLKSVFQNLLNFSNRPDLFPFREKYFISPFRISFRKI